MIHLREQYWVVEVPDKYAQITIDPVGPVLMWWSYEGTESGINLPPDNWQIVCTSKEATKEQACDIVEHDWDGFKDYGEVDLSLVPWISPIDSLKSLLTSKGCDINKNWLILKKL